MNLRHGFFTAVLLVCLSIAPARGQTALLRGTTFGTEKAGTPGTPLGFVTVQVVGSTRDGADISRGIMSLEDGRYFVAGIPAGRYVVRFTRVGYEAFEDSLVVTEDTTYEMDAVLIIAPVPMETIVIEEDRYSGIRDVQTGFVAMDADELARMPGIIEDDPVRVLQLLPGVQSASDFSSGLYIRGGGPDQTLVLLDQVAVYNPTHAFGFFSTFNADALSDINLYKGAYPAQLGGRLGSVLDVRSRDGNREKIKGRAGISTIASRLSLDGPAGQGTWMLSARRTHLDPLLDALRSEDNEVPDYYFYDLNGKLTFPALGGTVEISGYAGKDKLRLDLDADNYIDLKWGNALVTAGYRRSIRDDVLASVRVSASGYDSETAAIAFTTPIAITNHIRDYSVRGDLKWQAGIDHTVLAGIVATQYDVSYGQRFNTQQTIDYQREPYEGAAFLEDTWSPALGTIVQTGLRLRYIEDGSRWLFEPRIAATRALNGEVRLKLGGGMYNQYLQLVSTEGLSAADFYVPIDDTAEPASSWQAVGGVEWEPSSRYRFTAETYFTGLNDLVYLDNTTVPDDPSVSAVDIFYTDGEGYATGLELFAERRRGNVTGWASYTLGWTRRTFTDLNLGDPFPPKYDRRHDFSAVAEYTRGRWTFGGAFIYATGQAFTPATARYFLRNPSLATYPTDAQVLPAEKNSARLLPYNRLDLNAAWRFTIAGLPSELELQVFNVYNRRNEWFIVYDSDDETVTAEVVRMLPVVPSLGINVRF